MSDAAMRPLGVPVSEAERADISRQAGGTGSPVPSEWPEARTTTPVLPTDPPDLQARLHALVTEMRRRQPRESDWAEHPELIRLRSDVDHLTVIVEMAAEVAIHAAERADSHICALCSNKLDAIAALPNAELETGEAA